MFKSKLLTTLMVLLVALMASNAIAGAKLKVSDDSYIDFGYRLQTYWQTMKVDNTDDDPDRNGYDTASEFRIRRARLRLKGVVNPKVSVFLQTELAGREVQMIDAFVTFKPGSPWFQFIMGRNMAPSSRQALTSSGALMALDRPMQVANALNWGAGGAAPSNGSGPIPSTPDRVRDNGLTLFGSNKVGENNGFKYYLGAYNGVQSGLDDQTHLAARAQFNLWNPEGGYYNSSTYLGKKKTLGIGISYDAQSEVGAVAGANPGDPMVLVDYSLITFDGFLELPSSNGNAFTAELGFNMPDYDNPSMKMYTGSGMYGQVGYYFHSGLQPWFLYESFSSDNDAYTSTNAPDPSAVGKVAGDYTNMRFGLTYYIDGQHANVKLAYQTLTTDVPNMVGTTAEDTRGTFTLGFFTTY